MHKEKTRFTLRKPTKGKNPTTFSIEKFFCSTRDKLRPMIKHGQPLKVKSPNLIQHFTLPDLTHNFSPPATDKAQEFRPPVATHKFWPLQQKLPKNMKIVERTNLFTRASLRERKRSIFSFSSSLSFLIFIRMPRNCLLERVRIGGERMRSSFLYIMIFWVDRVYPLLVSTWLGGRPTWETWSQNFQFQNSNFLLLKIAMGLWLNIFFFWLKHIKYDLQWPIQIHQVAKYTLWRPTIFIKFNILFYWSGPF